MNASEKRFIKNNLSVGYVDAHSQIKKKVIVEILLFLKMMHFYLYLGHHVSANTSE